MSLLGDIFSPRKRLLLQEREIARLQRELEQLQARNASMLQGMRRCVTCHYRIDFKNRQGQAPFDTINTDPTD